MFISKKKNDSWQKQNSSVFNLDLQNQVHLPITVIISTK